MTPTNNHPLLAPRTAAEGFSFYVYTSADLDQIVREVWMPAADKGATTAMILAAITAGRPSALAAAGSKDLLAAIQRTTTKPRVSASVAVAPVKVVRAAPARSAWCARCGGPVSDGGRFCGEC